MMPPRHPIIDEYGDSTMLKRVALFLLLSPALLGFLPRHACADIYLYVNEAGETGIADNLESVPEKYRATAVNTTAREREQKLTQAQTGQQRQPNPFGVPVKPSAQTTTFTSRLIMTAGVVLVWFIILFILNKTGEFKGRENALPAARIALACIFLVYLVMVHGKDAVNLFTMAGNHIDAVREKQAQQGKKAGEAIKALNKLMDGAANPPPAPDQGQEKSE
jgi:hypothetical protein